MSGVKIIHIDPDFQRGFPQKVDTSMRNLTDQINVEMKKLAPYDTGALSRSLDVVKNADADYSIVDGVPYGIRRNFENKLHPQTLHYIERSAQNIAKGQSSRWWRAS